jgi:hypothetical protein
MVTILGVAQVSPELVQVGVGISCAMLVWAARHPHLSSWINRGLRTQRPRSPRQTFGWKAFT